MSFEQAPRSRRREGVEADVSEAERWAGLSVVQRYRTSVGGGAGDRAHGRADAPLAPLRRRILTSDLASIAVATLVGILVSSRASTWSVDPLLAIYGMPLIITLLWFSILVFRGAYDQRVIGIGTEEIRRVASGTIATFSVVAGVSYLFRADISRAYAFISLPLGLLLIIAVRFAWRHWLYKARRAGHYMHRTVLVGSGAGTAELATRFADDYYAGYQVVAEVELVEADVRELGHWLTRLDEVLDSFRADAVAITPSETLQTEVVRQLAWRLEGRNIDLLIAPALADLAGPRVSVRPVAGLPLLHLDEAVLSRPQAFAKRALDLGGALALIIVLSPVIVACAIAVRVSSRGPIVFRQTRIGRGGRPFTMLKFRTMTADADRHKEELRALHGIDNPMFKMADDPRITPAGRFLRRWSLDELPQFFNALSGSMSLVGPRPHPLDDVDRYEAEAYRRLALKPGLTGLWQVEGRSSLTWAEALQLDLYYVETWSLAGDIVLLARTVRAVLKGRGAS
jgi:exopolysaccharide biosynthesis polyprenyl glycosylphosphotransferase